MCCPGETDNGFLCNIKKIFTGMRRCGSPCKDKVYTYSMSQLKCIEKEVCVLEDETYCHEVTISDAICSNCVTDCEYLRCALNSISDKLECIRCDLQCAHECYDPVRDRCENELICQLMDRTRCLDMLVNDLCAQVCILECQGNCWPGICCGTRRGNCKPGCRSPCFTLRSVCDPCTPCGPSGSCGPCGPSGIYGPYGCGPAEPCGPCWIPGCPKPCPRPSCGVGCRKPCCKPDCGSPCKPGCRKPCCAKPACEIGCTKPCCRPSCKPGCNKGCCSTRYCERC